MSLKIGILTDTFNSEYEKRETFKRIGLEQFIDAIVCSGETGFTKDEKESYEIMLRKLDLNPSEVLFVGHQTYEMQGARKANIKSVSIVKGIGENIHIANLSELIELVS